MDLVEFLLSHPDKGYAQWRAICKPSLPPPSEEEKKDPASFDDQISESFELVRNVYIPAASLLEVL